MEFKVSRLELVALAACHLLAQLGILRMPVAWPIMFLLSTLLVWNSWLLACGALLRSVGSVLALELGRHGRARLWTREGLFEGRLVGQPFAGRWLTVLVIDATPTQSGPGRVEKRAGKSSRRFAVRVLADSVPIPKRKRLAALLRYSD